jgi:hypothetical protein
MNGDFVALDQGDVEDEQAQDALSFAHVDARVVPNPGELLSQLQDMAAHLSIERGRFFLSAPSIILHDVGMQPKLLIPICLEGVGDEPVVRIDLHKASPRKLSVIAGSLDMLAAQGVGLGGAFLQFALNREGDLQSHRRHQLDQQCADRGIDDFARHRLANLSSLADGVLFADVSHDRLTVFQAVANAHSLSTDAAQDAALKQARSLSHRS